MNDQAEFANIVKSGSIQQLKDFCYNGAKFHKIKHTLSFALMIDRLEEMQAVVDAARRALHHLSQREDIRAIDVLGDALTALDGTSKDGEK